jgi:predicted transcriptional regulator
MRYGKGEILGILRLRAHQSMERSIVAALRSGRQGLRVLERAGICVRTVSNGQSIG